jgi:hypothetical protein
LFAGQNTEGWWEDPAVFVDDYYHGTAWRLYLAAQLGAERTPEVHRAVEFLLRRSQNRDGGGLSHVGTRMGGGSLAGQWACLTGAMLEMLLHFGYGGDPRIQRAFGFLTSRQQGDGLYPCENFSPNNRTLPLNCYIGSVKPLLAVLALPLVYRTPNLKLLTERTAKTLLSYRLYIYKRAPGGKPAGKTGWLEFGFPRFWNTDLLEVSWVLARLGYGSHPAMNAALEIILDKQMRNGRWRLEFDYNDRLPVSIGKRSTGNSWVTLRALHTLKLCSAVLQPA